MENRLPLEEGICVAIPIAHKELYLQAVSEGYKDEVCGRCRMFFASYHHLVRCVDATCPMKSTVETRSLLDVLLGD